MDGPDVEYAKVIYCVQSPLMLCICRLVRSAEHDCDEAFGERTLAFIQEVSGGNPVCVCVSVCDCVCVVGVCVCVSMCV